MQSVVAGHWWRSHSPPAAAGWRRCVLRYQAAVRVPRSAVLEARSAVRRLIFVSWHSACPLVSDSTGRTCYEEWWCCSTVDNGLPAQRNAEVETPSPYQHNATATTKCHLGHCLFVSTRCTSDSTTESSADIIRTVLRVVRRELKGVSAIPLTDECTVV